MAGHSCQKKNSAKCWPGGGPDFSGTYTQGRRIIGRLSGTRREEGSLEQVSLSSWTVVWL